MVVGITQMGIPRMVKHLGVRCILQTILDGPENVVEATVLTTGRVNQKSIRSLIAQLELFLPTFPDDEATATTTPPPAE